MKKLLLALALLLPLPALGQTVLNPQDVALVCAYNAGAQTGTSGQFMYVQCDVNGRVLVSPASAPPSGAAGGSLKGTYPNPGLADINTIATSLAIGGATIGSNALAVTGSVQVSTNITAVNNLAAGNIFAIGWSSRTQLSSPSDGALTIANNGTTNSIALNVAQAASTPNILLPGTLFSGGTGTTTFPQILVQPTGTSAVTTWSTSGTILGANVVSGFAGNFLDFHVGGAASVYKVTSAGDLTTANSVTVSNNGGLIGLRNAATILSSPASASLQQGAADAASPVAQTTRVQSVIAGTSNTAGANWTQIGSLSTGSGTSGSLIFQVGIAPGAGSPTVQATATTALTIAGETLAATFAGNLLASQVGASNSGALFWTGRSAIKSSADGIIELQNAALTGFTRLNFGGTTSSFPSWSRSSAALAARLADDSADAAITSASISTSATNFLHITTGTLANGAAASLGTLTNAPAAGNPTKWVAINDNGTTRYIPAW